MELHFCSRCGISIPQSEVNSGSATGADGKYFCSEHRGGGAAVAVAEAERPSGSGASGDPSVQGMDPELLFCANCCVSIPLSDVKSGRAHREFGSLLCAGCSKADPGERAARKDAVEAEMAADVDAQDPVVARRCAVCSAAVPYGQIVTGKAKVEGDRVVCERCRAAAVAAPAPDGGGGWGSRVVLVLILVAACGIGYFAAQTWIEKKNGPKDAASEAKSSRAERETETRFKAFDDRLKNLEEEAGAPDKRISAEAARVDLDLASLRKTLADLRTDLAKSDAEMSERVAKIEGQLASMSAMMSGLAAKGPAAPSQPVPPVAEKPTPPPAQMPPAANDPPKNAPPSVNPAVAKLCKDLLESPQTEVRYAAAQELTTLKDPASVPSLVKALGDDHYFVRRGCARALSVIKAWFAVPALIKALEDREVYVALMANQSLLNITGNDFGVTQETPTSQRKTKAAAAEKWWEKNKDKPPDGVCLHPITE